MVHPANGRKSPPGASRRWPPPEFPGEFRHPGATEQRLTLLLPPEGYGWRRASGSKAIPLNIGR